MASEKTRPSDFHAYCSDVQSLEEDELHSILPVITELKLRSQMQYALQTKGKRIRSTLVFLSGESVGGNRGGLGRLALSVEFIHLATLVHDDILDEDMYRRNALSVYAKWSVKDAILVGDTLASFALHLCKGYKREIVDALIDACLQLSDGEYNDVEASATSLNEADYFGKIRRKCASLFKAACQCGALAGRGSRTEVNALEAFGENFGVAYQLRDDVSDAEAAGSDLQPDVEKFRVTLPLIHAFESSSEEQQNRLRRLLEKKTQESLADFVGELQGYFKNGSLDYCGGKLEEFVDRAVESLAPLKETVFKRYLVEMAQTLRTRSPKVDLEAQSTKRGGLTAERLVST